MKKSKVQEIVAKTRVFELKRKYDYLFVFDETSGIEKKEVAEMFVALKKMGIKGIGMYLKTKKGLDVYEADKKSKP